MFGGRPSWLNKNEDYVTLNTCPVDEEGVDCYKQSKALVTQEANRYIELLKLRFPMPDNVKARFKLVWFDHDFGPYHEVVVIYNTACKRSIAYAFWIERNLPEAWTDTLVFEMPETELAQYEEYHKG